MEGQDVIIIIINRENEFKKKNCFNRTKCKEHTNRTGQTFMDTDQLLLIFNRNHIPINCMLFRKYYLFHVDCFKITE